MGDKSLSIQLDFGAFTADAILFDTPVGRSVWNALPVTVSLTGWGAELYGPIPGDHGESRPVPKIPSGGIAYSRTGSYLCLFFGQDPAWPVDHIGQIDGDQWKALLGAAPNSVTVSKRSS